MVKSTNEVLRIQFHSEGNSSPRKGFQLQLLRFTSGTVSLRKAGEGYQNIGLQIGGNSWPQNISVARLMIVVTY